MQLQTSSEVVTKKTIATTTLLMTPTPTSSSTDDHSMAVIKRKQRTKRPRPSAPASSSESTTTEEEEDMAHCLILLAAGAAHATDPSPAVLPSSTAPHQSQAPPPQPRAERYTSRKYTEAAATPDGVRAGFYVYECKTCNKCFPTFQALGGHRASHKKPRLAAVNVDGTATTATTTMTVSPSPPPLAVAKPPPPLQTTAIDFPDVTVATALSLSSSVAAAASGKPRAHECSICGAEFASGQALGGHMRRHRPLNAPDRAVTTAIVATGNSNSKKEGINLELDLNLPAPSDEEAVVSSLLPPAVMLGLGQFNDGNKAGHMLTASALVDCHY